MTLLRQVFESRNCRVPDDLTATRIGYLRPYVRQSGDDVRPKWELGTRRLLDYLAVFVASGRGVFTLDGTAFEMSAGDLFWVPPDTPHAMRGDSAEMHCVYLHFDLLYDPVRSHWDAEIPAGTMDFGEYRARMHPPLYDVEINSWRGKIPLYQDADAILELMREMCRIHRRNATHPLALSGMMLEWIERIGRASRETAAAARSDDLQTAATYMERRFAERGLSIPEVARRCGFSESHFRRLFKLRFGMSPLAYLRVLRLRRAAELLLYTRARIGEAALACGFADIYDFSRCFRREYGVPPSRFRRR